MQKNFGNTNSVYSFSYPTDENSKKTEIQKFLNMLKNLLKILQPTINLHIKQKKWI